MAAGEAQRRQSARFPNFPLVPVALDDRRSDPAANLPPHPLALRLGYAGLLPFVLGAILTWLVRPEVQPYVTDALAKYAALIVAFLGGVHWGLGLRQRVPSPSRFAWAVAAMLLAWIAVVMLPYAGLALLGALLWLGYAVDRRVYPSHGLAAWLTLRFRLSVVAGLSCFVAAAGS